MLWSFKTDTSGMCDWHFEFAGYVCNDAEGADYRVFPADKEDGEWLAEKLNKLEFFASRLEEKE